MAKSKFTPQTKALETAKEEVLAAFTARKEQETINKLFGFFEKVGAETNQGMRKLLQTAYVYEDAKFYRKLMDDCIAMHKAKRGKKFSLGAADPG